MSTRQPARVVRLRCPLCERLVSPEVALNVHWVDAEGALQLDAGACCMVCVALLPQRIELSTSSWSLEVTGYLQAGARQESGEPRTPRQSP